MKVLFGSNIEYNMYIYILNYLIKTYIYKVIQHFIKLPDYPSFPNAILFANDI